MNALVKKCFVIAWCVEQSLWFEIILIFLEEGVFVIKTFVAADRLI